MRIVEYKFILDDNGNKIKPSYILDGGYFTNHNSQIALVPEEDDLDYYIPTDAIKVLTLEQFIARGIAEQNREGSQERHVNTDNSIMSDEELTMYLTNWWNNKIVE